MQIALIIVSIFTVATFAQKTDLQQNNFNGPVNTVRMEKNGQICGITTYNRAGNMIEQIEYDKGEPRTNTVYHYQESGRLNDIIISNAHGLPIKTAVYSYDDGDIIKRYYNVNGDLWYKEIQQKDSISTYDKDGNLIQQTHTNKSADGKKIETSLYMQADSTALARAWTARTIENGNQTTLTFDSSDADTGKIITTRNNDGSVMEIANYNATGTLTNKRIVKRSLDSYGNWILENTFDQDVKTSTLKLIETTSRTITYY